MKEVVSYYNYLLYSLFDFLPITKPENNSNYYSSMTQYNFALCYLRLYLGRSIKTNRIINICVTITSSAAIAAWAAWQDLAFIWGLIIVLSQVVFSINQFLPYQKRIEDISGLLSKWNGLYINIESDWYILWRLRIGKKANNLMIFT